jgi:flagellar motor switch protein FliM
MPADDRAPEGNEVLSQAEVEALLSQVTQDQAGPPGGATASAPAPAPEVRSAPETVRPYDFRSPSLLTTTELRRARLRHDGFARLLATRLSIYLRMDFGAQVGGLQTLPQPKFIDGLPNPTHITLFEVESLNGTGFLVIPLRLGFSLLDRLLGGTGSIGEVEGGLTDIEVGVLDVTSELLLKEWCQALARAPEARPRILGHETNPRFLPPSTSDLHMFHLSLDVRLGECAAQVQLAFPFPMVEGIIRQPDPASQAIRAEMARSDAPQPRWRGNLEDVQIPLRAGWDGIEVTAQQLAHLQVGDILPLQPHHFNQVRVRLARVCKFIGRLGMTNNVRAVELTGTFPSDRTALP